MMVMLLPTLIGGEHPTNVLSGSVASYLCHCIDMRNIDNVCITFLRYDEGTKEKPNKEDLFRTVRVALMTHLLRFRLT